jgi:hypothetical protein
VGTSLFIEFWVTNAAFVPSAVNVYTASALSAGLPMVSLAVSFAQISINVDGTQYNWNVTVDANPHYIAAQITLPAVGGSAWSATLHLDGTTQATGAQTIGARNSDSWAFGGVQPNGGSVSAVQMSTESAAVPSYPFTPTAVLDPSLNAIQVCPAVSGDPWQSIQQICDAEFGVAGFDESGIFRFRNRNTIRSQPVARSITSASSLSSVSVETLAAAVVNRAQVSATPWSFSATGSIVWSLGTQLRVPARKTVTIPVTTSSLVYAPDTSITVATDTHISANTSQFRASVDKAGVSTHLNPPTFTVTQTAPDTLTITATNNSSQDAWLVSSSDYTDIAVGTPMLQLAAKLVTQGDTLVSDFQYPAVADGGAASSRFGEVAWQASDNPWVQSPSSANQLARDVVLDAYIPRPNLTGITILPDPRLQLVDTVHIQDPDVTGVDEYARIFAWTLTLADQWSMTIDARTVAAPGAWILGVPGRSELGATTYLPAA